MIKNYPLQIQKTVIEDDDKSIGKIIGLASTFGNVDREGDTMAPTAFNSSVKRLKKSGQTLPLFLNHNPSLLIGGIRGNGLKITDEGLEVTALVDLTTQRGKESYSLARNGFLSSYSVGFDFEKEDVDFDPKTNGFTFKDVDLREISLTSIPADTEADIRAVKTVTPFKNFPLADADVAWDKSAADARVKDKTGSEDSPSASYRNAFMWYDSANADEFGAYKLPYVDVIDGSLKAIPRAIFAIAAVLNGARGGVNIPENDQAVIKGHVEKYYKKMGRDSPFGDKSVCVTIHKFNELLKLQLFNQKLKEELLCLKYKKH